MELLPALAVFGALTVEWVQMRVRGTQPLVARFMPQMAMMVIVLNTIGMMYKVPLVLQEAKHNSVSRVAFDTALAKELDGFMPGMPVMIENSDHVGALQMAGIPLKQTVGESDWDSWSAALKAPAEHAAYVISVGDDVVAQAVKAHPDGLNELAVMCTTGQPCARVYQSTKFGAH